MEQSVYIAIDLKSFYASVECVARGLDPLTTNLVVADGSRTDKTICLAVSPSLKARGIPGRPRLFEVIQKVKLINAARRSAAPHHKLEGESCDDRELAADPSLAVGYITASPHMSRYVEVSARIYDTYLDYIAPEDIVVYSIDEVFIDATKYLPLYKLSAHELALRLVREVLSRTGITATVGIGTNLYLAKIAMDIYAKHQQPDADGVRIAELDVRSYRQKLWTHEPLSDFWRIGHGYIRRLTRYSLHTMGDIARASLNPDGLALLYRLFGVNAELLIDHAWGIEPCTMADIRAYKPASHSLSSGQVLQRAYHHDEGRLIVREMCEELALSLVAHNLVTDQIILDIGFEAASPGRVGGHALKTDHYGRRVPSPVHGSVNLGHFTTSTSLITDAALSIYDVQADAELDIRRVNVTAAHLRQTDADTLEPEVEELDLFATPGQLAQQEAARQRERREITMQHTLLDIKKKYGPNAILRATSLQEGATAIARNGQIGGHKA